MTGELAEFRREVAADLRRAGYLLRPDEPLTAMHLRLALQHIRTEQRRVAIKTRVIDGLSDGMRA